MLRDLNVFTPEGSAQVHFTISSKAMRLSWQLFKPLDTHRNYLRTLRRFRYVPGSARAGGPPRGKRLYSRESYRNALLMPRSSYFVVENQRVALWQLAADYIIDHADEAGKLMTHLRYNRGPWVVPKVQLRWFADCLQAGSSWYVHGEKWTSAVAQLARQSSGDLLVMPSTGPRHYNEPYAQPIKAGVWTPESPDAGVQEEWQSLPSEQHYELMMRAAHHVTDDWNGMQTLTPTTILEKRYAEYTLEDILARR